MTDWLEIHRGDAPLIVSFPHTGVEIPDDVQGSLNSLWLARKDADWWVERLYDFARELGATTVRTRISRTVIDVNRDPSGQSLYPGMATTELCPTHSFDGEPLYRNSQEPNEKEIERRKRAYFLPYHAALAAEIERLRERYAQVVLYDAHAIRGHIPRLFPGDLPDLNIGTNDGATCASELSDIVESICAQSRFSSVLNGRFKGGWTVRHYGNSRPGVHAVQMELACRAYMNDPEKVDEGNWPIPYHELAALPLRTVLRRVLEACLSFARSAEARKS